MPDGPPSPLAVVRRHDLATLGAVHAAHAAPGMAVGDRDLVQRWVAAGRPLIVRTQPPAALAAGRLGVGLPLPPAQGKRRLALEVDRAHVVNIRPPPLLRDTIPSLPEAWRVAALRVAEGADGLGLALRVFGSAAWQTLTGASYLSAGSDLDLLWEPASHAQLDAMNGLLREWQRSSGVRVDGEIVFGDRAVSWREWQQAPASARLLVKHLRGVALCTRSELLRGLHDSPGGERAA